MEPGLSTGSHREEARYDVVRGLDLSRKRLDFHLLDAEGVTVVSRPRPVVLIVDERKADSLERRENRPPRSL